MGRNIKSNRKYLLLIPLVVSLIMLTFFSFAYDEIVREKHEQKFSTVKNSLNYIVSIIDHFAETDADWDEYNYASILLPVFTNIDETSAVHVVLLNHDLVPLSGNFVYHLDKTFDLRNCKEFVKAVEDSDDRGELTITVDDGTKSSYEMRVYFKKIPTGNYNDKLIAVYGVSKHAIEDNFAPWLVWGIVGMISMTVLLQLWMILYISKLSDEERSLRMKAENWKVI